MPVIIDEVTADITSPQRASPLETGPSTDMPHTRQIKQDVMQSIERAKQRELRLIAD